MLDTQHFECLNRDCRNTEPDFFEIQGKKEAKDSRTVCLKCNNTYNTSMLVLHAATNQRTVEKSYENLLELRKLGLDELFFKRYKEVFDFTFQEFLDSLTEYDYHKNLPLSKFDEIYALLIRKNSKYDVDKLATVINHGHNNGYGGFCVMTPFTCVCGKEEVSNSSLLPRMCTKCSEDTAIALIKALEKNPEFYLKGSLQ